METDLGSTCPVVYPWFGDCMYRIRVVRVGFEENTAPVDAFGVGSEDSTIVGHPAAAGDEEADREPVQSCAAASTVAVESVLVVTATVACEPGLGRGGGTRSLSLRPAPDGG